MDELHQQLAQVIAVMAQHMTPEQRHSAAADLRGIPDEMAGSYRRSIERMATLLDEYADEEILTR